MARGHIIRTEYSCCWQVNNKSPSFHAQKVLLWERNELSSLGGRRHGSNSLLELQAEVLARVRAEAAGSLSVPDPLGAIPAAIADLTVDL